jgi:hypothetical protein
MEFVMDNPNNNFGDVTDPSLSTTAAATFEKEQAFHLETFDFDLKKDYPKLIPGEKSSVKKFEEKIINGPPSKLVIHGIDYLKGNSLKPKLKCDSPCYTCLDGKPKWCTACWGPGVDKKNKLTFL